MKRFLAVYIGIASARERSGWDSLSETERQKREEAAVAAWMDWGTINRDRIVDTGTPLGKTKRISEHGIDDIKNNLVGYVIVEAESHQAAAQLFEKHPHFMLFPGDSVEVMECLPLPGM